MKNTQFHFRCIPNPRVIYTPEYMHDVEGMRKHPEYEEVDGEGNLVAKTVLEELQRIPLRVEPVRQAPVQKAPRKGRK